MRQYIRGELTESGEVDMRPLLLLLLINININININIEEEEEVAA